MDTALILRKLNEEGKVILDHEIDEMLKNSKIVGKLTNDYEENHFFHIFRIMCLSEIPYINRLPYTQRIISYISRNLSTACGVFLYRRYQLYSPLLQCHASGSLYTSWIC